MSVQLKELLEKIKTEGVKEAEDKASEIIRQAEDNAKKILTEAKAKAESIVKNAQDESAQLKSSSEEAIKQAARDMVLSLKTEITELFDKTLSFELRAALDIGIVKESILSIAKVLGESGLKGVEISVPEKNLDDIKKYVLGKMSAEAKKGFDIKPSKELDVGFRIAEKDGTAFYDLTDKGISDFLVGYLNPKIAEILKEA
jgi:V/A-type H+/Na+-transporting ATPase subunit E